MSEALVFFLGGDLLCILAVPSPTEGKVCLLGKQKSDLSEPKIRAWSTHLLPIALLGVKSLTGGKSKLKIFMNISATASANRVLGLDSGFRSYTLGSRWHEKQ